jgi:hypothetical protein
MVKILEMRQKKPSTRFNNFGWPKSTIFFKFMLAFCVKLVQINVKMWNRIIPHFPVL